MNQSSGRRPDWPSGFGLWEVIKKSLTRQWEICTQRKAMTLQVFSSASLTLSFLSGCCGLGTSRLWSLCCALVSVRTLEDSLNLTAPASRQLFSSSKPAMKKAQNTLNLFIFLLLPFSTLEVGVLLLPLSRSITINRMAWTWPPVLLTFWKVTNSL